MFLMKSFYYNFVALMIAYRKRNPSANLTKLKTALEIPLGTLTSGIRKASL